MIGNSGSLWLRALEHIQSLGKALACVGMTIFLQVDCRARTCGLQA